MATIDAQISSVSSIICSNIGSLASDRALLSQNMLAQLRNLVEAVAARLHNRDGHIEFSYELVGPAIGWIGSQNKRIGFLYSFHNLLKISTSHYAFEGDASERLMLKYFEYLMRVRQVVQDEIGLTILSNLEEFPIDIDPSLREYHKKIVERITIVRKQRGRPGTTSRYYIHKARPFFLKGRIYYEITFSNAINNVGKFDRMIAFTDVDLSDKYASNMTLVEESISVLGQVMPILLVTSWEISIRPCEFNNFAKLVGVPIKVSTSQREYRELMRYLTTGSASLLHLLESSDRHYEDIRSTVVGDISSPPLFLMLDQVRVIIRNRAPGHNILRYLLLKMNNVVIKKQYDPNPCRRLSNLNLSYGCIPFDHMPFCTSLKGHNPRFIDLIESIDPSDREHEILARRIKNNVEQRGNLYTPVDEVEAFGSVENLASRYNSNLYHAHTARRLEIDKGHLFLKGFEDDTFEIIENIRTYISSGIGGYEGAVGQWIDENESLVDDESKKRALQSLFSRSRVAIIYGAAGTGKSTMVNLIANYFNDFSKLFLTHTHPAKENLQRRVMAQQSHFRTIRSYLSRENLDEEFDILIIDECSTVCNTDMLKILRRANFKLLVLVGDVFQIESIEFGNWFDIIRSFVPRTAVFELTTPYRTKNVQLLGLWDRVRNLADDIEEWISSNGYSTNLDKSLFLSRRADEIILCLNYDGIYGINNINRFLQSSNPGKSAVWDIGMYKVGDPIVFNETNRFGSVIFNNLKGKIVDIVLYHDHIQFDVSIDRSITSLHVSGTDLLYMGESTVRFSVYKRGSTDDDDDQANTVVPFQVAYAVSIHKAQGLEYESVKVVITDANEEDVSHSIFYTAITRARDQLQIFWTPETQKAVLDRFDNRKDTLRDIGLLMARRGIRPTR